MRQLYATMVQFVYSTSIKIESDVPEKWNEYPTLALPMFEGYVEVRRFDYSIPNSNLS